MKYLALSDGFHPMLNGLTLLRYEEFTFSGGEPHIKLKDDPDDTGDAGVRISIRLNSFNDVGRLCVAVDALRRYGYQHIECVIPYFPAARQDRVMVSGEPLSVKVYADIINSLRFDRLYIVDPHSDVTPVLLNNVSIIDITELIVTEVITRMCKENESLVLLAPDAGAIKRTYKLASFLTDVKVVTATKVRDVSTGRIKNYEINTDSLAGERVLVIDDICDGGRTFLELAKAANAKDVGSLHLFVTHGIFSKGLDALSEAYDSIYTTNSIGKYESSDKLTVLNIPQWYY